MPLIPQAFIEWLILCWTLFQVAEGGRPALKSQVGAVPHSVEAEGAGVALGFSVWLAA